MIRTENVIM